MPSHPDLDELLREESDRVEWKENVADVDDVVRTLAAFANDYKKVGGGWVVCGIEEGNDEHGFSVARTVGLEASRFKELEHAVPARCRSQVDPPINPEIQEFPVPGRPDKRILAFYMKASNRVHWAQTTRGKRRESNVWYRDNKHTRGAGQDIIIELMRAKGELPPFLDDACPSASRDDIDSRLFEEFHQRHALPYPVSHYLEPDASIDSKTPPLMIRDASGAVVATRLAILLFGQEPTRFLRGASAVIAVYPGAVKSGTHSQRFDLAGPLPQLITDVLDKLDLHSGRDIDKSTEMRGGSHNRPRYARRALEEAVVNAFVHRDYASQEPVRIDVFKDRIELANPGGLLRGQDDERLAQGQVRPSWRNPSLVSFMLTLGLAQNLGQGLRTIIDETRQIGGKRPTFRLHGDSFEVVLHALRPLLVPSEDPAERMTEPRSGRAGLLLVSIGAPSIRTAAIIRRPEHREP